MITFLVFTTTGGSFQVLDGSPPDDGVEGGTKVGTMKTQLIVEEYHSLVVVAVWLQALVAGEIVKLVVDD